MKPFSFRRLVRHLLLPAALLPIFASCNKDNRGDTPAPYFCEGKYLVLNNGDWGKNDASVGRWQDVKKVYYPNAFYQINNQHLGDLGQDAMVYGSKIYIAVSGSKKIFVTDLNLHLIRTINSDDMQPRQLAAAEGKVYATLYEGYLAEIDTTDFSLRKTKVGDYPEGVVVYNEKAYVANSGGLNYPDYGKTLSVVDLTSFQEETTLTVNDNPQGVWVVGNKLYVLSWGKYDYDLHDYFPRKLQVYSLDTKQLQDVDYDKPAMCALYGERLYVLADVSNMAGATVYIHNAQTNEKLGTFLTSEAQVTQACSLSVTKDYLWIGTSDYKTTGEMLVWNRETKARYASFDTAGINPQKVIELPE